MSCFTESFQKLCLEHKNTFFQNSSQLFPILSHTYLRLLMHQKSSRKPHTYPYTFHIFLVEIFSDLRVSVDTGKMLKMTICNNCNPRIFIIFPLPPKMRVLWGSSNSRESLRSRLFNQLIFNFMFQEESYCTLITWKGKNKVWTNHNWRNNWYQIFRRTVCKKQILRLDFLKMWKLWNVIELERNVNLIQTSSINTIKG